MNKDEIVQVQLFSHFSMKYRHEELNEDAIRSNMLVKLLAYLLSNHTYKLDMKTLCEVLWQEGESENPSGALKNLFYRLRMILNKNFTQSDFIKTLRGAYAWNHEIPVELDVERFEECIHEAKVIKDERICKSLLEEAVILYRGEFLASFDDEQWILQRTTYYHSLFIRAIKMLVNIYEKEGSYEKMEALCRYAIRKEPYDDTLHSELMRSYIHQGRKKEAESYYKQTSKLYFSELGTSPSKEFQSLYEELLKEMKAEELDLSVIQKDLSKTKLESLGAFYCEYGVFKMIYVLQQRQAKRMGISVYCGLITIKSMLNLPPNSDAYHRFLNVHMKLLKEQLLGSLRACDVVARYSPSQYVLLIPSADFEGGLIALERIEQKFYQATKNTRAKLICVLREMEL